MNLFLDHYYIEHLYFICMEPFIVLKKVWNFSLPTNGNEAVQWAVLRIEVILIVPKKS